MTEEPLVSVKPFAKPCRGMVVSHEDSLHVWPRDGGYKAAHASEHVVRRQTPGGVFNEHKAREDTQEGGHLSQGKHGHEQGREWARKGAHHVFLLSPDGPIPLDSRVSFARKHSPPTGSNSVLEPRWPSARQRDR